MNSQSPDLTSSLTTLRDYIRWGASRFAEAKLVFGHGTASALDDAAALVLHTLHLPYNLSEFYLQSALTLEERQALVGIIERRISERKPTAYLTHEAIFAGLSFYVDERVLVPRSPIAELIEQRFAPWVEESQVERILDLCTGSACIAIACAYAFPDAEVDAADISDDALKVAEINLDKHQLTDELMLHQSDLFDALPDVLYDIIVSNPPYVGVEEWQQLPPEFHSEPEIGFVAGATGLDIVIRILVEAKNYLMPEGILVVEVGNSAETLQATFPNVPFYWLDFERGGDGVFLLTAEQVNAYHEDFSNTRL
jgi:ribosomal protein L3 glutamine methyltransferase